MDMKALKVGQHVILSDALPGGGTEGVVIGISKYRVTVQVDAQIEGVDGAYCVHFDGDGNVNGFCDWTDSKAGWEWGSPCPIPDLKIIGIKEEGGKQYSMPSIGIDMSTGLTVGPQQDRDPREVGRAASHDSIDHDDPSLAMKPNTMILKKSERDGGGFGKFRTMTLEDARALLRSSLVWALGDKGEAQLFAFSGEYTDRDVESMLVEVTGIDEEK